MEIPIKNLLHLATGRPPGQLVIQFTDKCNARCPQCGMRVTNRFKRCTLATEEVRRIIDAAARKGFAAVSFTGGEPLIEPEELISHLEYADRAGIPYTRTGTNGFLFARADGNGYMDNIKRLADRLAATALRNFWISLDSADPGVHETMRGLPGVVKGMEKALPIFHERGLFPSANLGLNRNTGGNQAIPDRPSDPDDRAYLDDFEEAFYLALQAFYDRIVSLGFTMVNTCYPMSVDQDEIEQQGLSAVYAATSPDDVIRFTRAEKARLFRALLRAVPEYRSRLRIFSPLVSLYSLARDYEPGGTPASYPCRGGHQFWFVDARNGNTYPCGYRGGDGYGKFYNQNGNGRRSKPDCRGCDWECFRDPSELMGPISEGFTSPLGLLKRLRRDPQRFRYWLEDLRYFRACGFFDGRRPPDGRKLEAFGPGRW
ncbi:MAG: radical SAM protein [Proteobacteria bacterium]|nr:radical SAM protein [Pseudomonadota bacterium]